MGSTTTTSTLTTITLHTQPTKTPTTINMSAPNVDAPNEGIVGQVTNSVKNAANYVSETIQGNAAEASKDANKEQAKGNVGDTTMSGRASGALGAASDKLDQTKHESAGKANKEAIKVSHSSHITYDDNTTNA